MPLDPPLGNIHYFIVECALCLQLPKSVPKMVRVSKEIDIGMRRDIAFKLPWATNETGVKIFWQVTKESLVILQGGFALVKGQRKGRVRLHGRLKCAALQNIGIEVSFCIWSTGAVRRELRMPRKQKRPKNAVLLSVYHSQSEETKFNCEARLV